MPATPLTSFRLPADTIRRLDRIVKDAKRAKLRRPANRTEALIDAIDRYELPSRQTTVDGLAGKR